MARARSTFSDDDSDDIAPDALSLLRRDHRLAEELFAEFARAAPQQLDPLARRICKMLRVHTQIEEELFYPAVGRALTNDDAAKSPSGEILLADAAIFSARYSKQHPTVTAFCSTCPMS